MICYWCYELRCICYAVLLFVDIMFMRVVCCVLIVRCCLFCRFPFCSVLYYSCAVFYICYVCAIFFWCSFVLFCCQWVSEYSSNQSNRIVLFFSILFCSCACFLFVVLSAYVIYDKKIPTFIRRGLLFCVLFYLNIESSFLLYASLLM